MLPKGKRFIDFEFRDSTITAEIARKVSALSLNWPILHISPERQGSTDAEDRAGHLEKWTQEALREAGSRNGSGANTFEAVVDATVGDGGGWTKVLFSKDLWDVRYSILTEDFTDDGEYLDSAGATGQSKYKKYDVSTEKAKRGAGVPFYWLPVDVATVYPSWTGSRLTEVMEVSERPLSEVLFEQNLHYTSRGEIIPSSESLEAGVAEGTSNAPTTVKFIEYWNLYCYAYAVIGGSGRAFCGPFEHNYQRVPYFYAPGLLNNYWHGRKVGNSVSESKAYLVEYNQFLTTLHAQVAAMQAWPILFRKRGPQAAAPNLQGNDKKPISETKYNIGTIIEGGVDEDLTVLAWPQIASSLKDQMTLTQKMIDRLDSPRMNGDVKGLEGAGFAVNTVLAESKVQDAPFAHHLEDMLKEVTLFIYDLARRVVKETIYVAQNSSEAEGGWLALNPKKDLKVGFGIHWFIDPERASAKLIDARYLHERVRAGTLGLDQAIERMGDNPSEVQFYIALAEIRATNEYKQLRNQMVFEHVGRGDVIAKAVDLAKNGTLTGLGSSTTSPAAPGVAVPGPAGQPTTATPAPPVALPAAPGALRPSALPSAPGVPAVGGPVPTGSPSGPGSGGILGPAGPPGVPLLRPGGTGPGLVIPNRSAAAGLIGRRP